MVSFRLIISVINDIDSDDINLSNDATHWLQKLESKQPLKVWVAKKFVNLKKKLI